MCSMNFNIFSVSPWLKTSSINDNLSNRWRAIVIFGQWVTWSFLLLWAFYKYHTKVWIPYRLGMSELSGFVLSRFYLILFVIFVMHFLSTVSVNVFFTDFNLLFCVFEFQWFCHNQKILFCDISYISSFKKSAC